MASAQLRLLLPPPTTSLSRHKPITTIPSCSSNPNPQPEHDQNGSPPAPSTPTPTDLSPGPRKKPAGSISLPPLRGPSALERAEPPNFEIGWKRTKEIRAEKPKGWQIADFLEKLESLMGRDKYGSKELLAKVGCIVAERAREEAEALREKGEVEERAVTELRRVLRLMEMDMEMVKAAAKEETLKERVETAKARCRQAILVALSF
ncbi:uncharacterized protein M6B38_401505 [Iris pallida]|uniref:Chlororespiratory reduction 41 n=1 Tax=Iris pallida TaxID=29817 RepID=A0AAX6FTT5_IRIPA|nr:uncharacterized protein M6B38_401505 [Iris pallida]